MGVNSWVKPFFRNRNQSVLIEEKLSHQYLSSKVSALGAYLFLAYANDLHEPRKSRSGLFADETIVYLIINSPSVPDQESNWTMEFNHDKREVIRVYKKKNIPHAYKLHNTELKSAETAKYLRITISKDIS